MRRIIYIYDAAVLYDVVFMNTARSLWNQIKFLLTVALACCLIGAGFGFVSYLLERV